MAFLLIMAAAFTVYSNTLTVPFAFDDSHNILQKEALRMNRLTFQGVERAALKGTLKSRPIANVSFALNYWAHGYDLPGYHLVNMTIHGMSGFVLYLVISSTIGAFGLQGPGRRTELDALNANAVAHSQWASPALLPAITAVIWVVHPVQTQAVTYIVQRMTSLATFFYLLSLFFYIRWRLCPSETKKWLWMTGAVASGLLALGSKEIAVTLPLIIFIYEWYFFQNLSRHWFGRNIWILFIATILLGSLICIMIDRTPWEIIAGSYRHREFTLSQRVMTQFRVVVFYIGLLLFPHPSRLNLDHDFPLSFSPCQPLTTMGAMGIVFGLVLVAVAMAKRERLLSFCLFWFFANLFLESSVIGLEIIFEHRLYLPSCFFIPGAVVLMHRVIRSRKLEMILLAAMVACLGYWTLERNRTWQNPVRFWADCAAKSPGKARPQINYGEALARVGEHGLAEKQYRRALAIDPTNPTALNNLGLELMRRGKLEDATALFKKGIHAKKGFVGLHHYNLANILRLKGDNEGAVKEYLLALKANPAMALARNNLGIAYALMGRYDEAIQQFEKALKIAPDFLDARKNLARALSDRKKTAGVSPP